MRFVVILGEECILKIVDVGTQAKNSFPCFWNHSITDGLDVTALGQSTKF